LRVRAAGRRPFFMRCHERAGEFLDPSDTLARSPFIRKKFVWEDLASRREVAKCHECFEAKREHRLPKSRPSAEPRAKRASAVRVASGDREGIAARKASQRRRSPHGKLIANAIARCRFIPMANRDRPSSCAIFSRSFSTKLRGANSGHPHRFVRFVVAVDVRFTPKSGHWNSVA